METSSWNDCDSKQLLPTRNIQIYNHKVNFKTMTLLTKEDYLKLGIERLAELNVEKDKLLYKQEHEQDTPYAPYAPYIPYEIKTSPLCYEEGGVCTNPQMDCINCPKKSSSIRVRNFQQEYTNSIKDKE